QGGVSRAFTYSVDRTFDLPGTVHHRRDGVSRRQAKVVMTMSGYDDILNAPYIVHQVLYFSPIFIGETIACGVRNIQNSGSGFDYCLANPCQILIIRSACIFRIELHIFYERFGVFYRICRPTKNLVAVAVEFMQSMTVGSS